MTNKKRDLWQIMIPVLKVNSLPYSNRYHKKWDTKIKEISKGITLYRPAPSKWISKKNNKLADRLVVPVQVICTEDEIQNILDMTKDHYGQMMIFCYKLSDDLRVV